MKFYIFIQNNEIMGVGQAEVLTPSINTIEISEEIYNMFVEDRDYIIWDSENKRPIKNPNYEQIKAEKREAEFNANFFPTSLGYIKRQVTMQNGVTKDFITDLIPLMMDIPGVPVIVYGKPDFTKEVTEETLLGLQQFVKSTPELIKECREQAIIDFYGFNPVKDLLYPTEPEPTPEEPETIEPEVVEPTPEEPETIEPEAPVETVEPEVVEPTPEVLPETETEPEETIEPLPEETIEPLPEEPIIDEELVEIENIEENLEL